MDPKELEQKVKELCVAKLTEMISDFDDCKFYKKNQLFHLSEMVKLVHQIRSIN